MTEAIGAGLRAVGGAIGRSVGIGARAAVAGGVEGAARAAGPNILRTAGSVLAKTPEVAFGGAGKIVEAPKVPEGSHLPEVRAIQDRAALSAVRQALLTESAVGEKQGPQVIVVEQPEEEEGVLGFLFSFLLKTIHMAFRVVQFGGEVGNEASINQINQLIMGG